MKRVLLPFLILCLISFSAVAEPSKRESVQKLLDLMNARSMVDSMQGQLQKMVAGMAQRMNIPASERADFDQFMSAAMERINARMSWENMEKPMVDLYLKHYTEEEIQDMVTFYGSETGQSMVKKMPQVMQEAMQMSQQMMRDLIPELRQLAEEMKAKQEKG